MSNPHDFRRDKLRRALRDEGVDALLITNPLNVTYLTGFTGDSTALILQPDRELAVSDARYTGQLGDECPGLPLHIRPVAQKLPQAIAECIGKLGLSTVGFEPGYLTVADFEGYREMLPSVQWKPGSDRVEKLRQVKDAFELAAIRHAIRLAEKAFAVLQATLTPTDTERQ